MKLSAPADRWRLLFSRPPARFLPSIRRFWPAALAAVALALFLARAPLVLAAAALVGVGLLLAALIEPVFALAALALALPFGGLWPLPLPGVNAVDLLVALAAAAWLAQGIVRRKIRWQSPHLTWPALIFVWVLALSLTQAVSWRQGLPEWLKWAEFVVLYVVASQAMPPKRVAWVLAALFAAGLVEVALGAYQFVRQVGPEEFILMGRFMRAYGTFQQPNPYAGYLGYLAPVAASLALAGLGRWFSTRGSGERKHLWLGLACAAVALALAAGIGMSWSRGSWMGLAGSLVVVFGLRRRRSAPLVAAGLLIIIVALAVLGTSWLPAPIASRLADLDVYSAQVDLNRVEVTDANFAVLERLGHWQAGLAMFSDHPWLGVGIGNYAVAYPGYEPAHFYDPLGHAHDVYINFLAETGVAGAGAFAAFWLAACWSCWQTARRNAAGSSRADYTSALAVGVLGALAYVTVHNLFDNLFVAHMQLQLALLLAAVAAVGGRQADPIGH